MILLVGQVYRCQNKECRAEAQILKESIEGMSNPSCCCGAVMKKSYSPPLARKLEPSEELLRRLGEEFKESRRHNLFKVGHAG